MARYPGFLAGSAPSQSVIATSERTVNFYLEKIGTEGPQSKLALYPTPGFQAFATVADLGGRAAISINNRTWLVWGTGFYEILATGVVTKLGVVVQDSNLAQIVYNGPTGNQLLIASGGNAYCYNITTATLTLVLTGEANQIGMLDEYGFALNQTTGKMRLSNLNDFATWDPTQFALRSAQPDPWQAIIINSPDIWLLGGLSGDIWYDAGTSPFPLAARVGLNIPYGIAASFSLAVINGQVLWLTMNKLGAGQLVLAQGYSPQVISTPEFATALSTYQRTSTIADAEATPMQVEGHDWYVLRFPQANATWCYDLTTRTLFELGKWNGAQMRFDVWGPRVHCYAFGKHLVGDNMTGTIAQMDITFGSEVDGTAIRRLRRGPVLINEDKRLSISRFELMLEAGLGLSTGQGSDPQVLFRASSDGGKTWGNERQAGAGMIGQYRKRVFWTRCGSPRLWVPEVVMSDPVPWRIVDAFVNNAAA